MPYSAERNTLKHMKFDSPIQEIPKVDNKLAGHTYVVKIVKDTNTGPGYIEFQRSQSSQSLQKLANVDVSVPREQALEILPPDFAKKQYLKKYDSGWGKMHELLIKDNE